ncbi:MAG: extracellular solute-binding protein, partial [Anaerolineae bacterium]|nr:extracellular solute-binding protein [Anaerolineae bacterium]
MLPRRFSILIGLVLVLVVGSCAPAATPTTAPTKPPAKAEKIKLVVADQFTEAGYGPLADKIYKEYMAKHPNIEIEHNIIQLNDPTIKTALVSGTGPDLIYFDTGPGYAGKLIEAEVLLPLDEYAKQYGWDTKIFKWARDRASANGKLYGLGLEMEFLGVFYNKELFEKEGWKVPETDQETLEYCAKAKAKGYIPFAYGDRPGWQAFHQFGMVVNNVLGIEAAGKLFFENQGKWTQPDIVKATKFFFVDMLKAGCFMPDVTAVEYNDSNMAFFTGKAPMLNTGTWIIDDINKNAKDFTPQMVPFPSIGGKDRI